MLSAVGPGGLVWGLVVVGMLAVLLVVFARRLRRDGSGRLVLIGVLVGLAVAGLALLQTLGSR